MERTLDSILETFEISFFHYRLLIMCGLGFMADAMEVALLSFMSVCAGVEWNLSDAQKASIVGAVFIGELFGSTFWGRIADKFGRRFSFTIACIVISGAGLLSALSPTYGWLLTLRAIVGFGVGGLSVPFDLLAEFLPTRKRGEFLINIQYFWSLGSLFIAGIAWATISTGGWRTLTLVTAVPVTIASIVSTLYLPESPRWLLSQGRPAEAEKIVRDTAVMCGAALAPFKLVLEPSSVTHKHVEGVEFFDLIRTPSRRKVTLVLWAVWGLFGFSYNGVIIFVSRIYSSIVQASASASSSASSSSETCSFDYEPVFVSALSEILGVLAVVFMVDRIGRVRSQSGLYLFGALTVALMGVARTPGTLMFVGILARAAVFGASSATWVATPELYPTEMRATGHSLCSSMARIGGFLVPYLVFSSSSLLAVGLVLGLANIGAALFSWQLPETSIRHLDERIEISDAVESPIFSRCSSSGVTLPTDSDDDSTVVWPRAGSTSYGHTPLGSDEDRL